ncbi:MAG: leucyl/phenylalanyl-tRNA--protein transferase [Bacteroidetes bacterium]|nr:MAG: leucyl/phenylalanyl-tRNA--protein transferase [Bacteroidota bacterium]TAG86488.1 MAG: leucyl/phenylalanyl-tRNA--protein transferase [Bacteroidota bacterium]
MHKYHYIEKDEKELYFPLVHTADKQGIVAIGGDLSIERILLAYHSGIFPWFCEEDPILWWSPNPRFVLYPQNIKISKSMKQVLKSNKFKITFDTDFRSVIGHCQSTFREGQNGTWLSNEMLEQYCELHRLGFAHSVEVWQENIIVGGLYGLALGSCFFGESMFAHVSNASKAGFITLVQKLIAKNFTLIDCQVYTQHLESLGAEGIMRYKFMSELQKCLEKPTLKGNFLNE